MTTQTTLEAILDRAEEIFMELEDIRKELIERRARLDKIIDSIDMALEPTTEGGDDGEA